MEGVLPIRKRVKVKSANAKKQSNETLIFMFHWSATLILRKQLEARSAVNTFFLAQNTGVKEKTLAALPKKLIACGQFLLIHGLSASKEKY